MRNLVAHFLLLIGLSWFSSTAAAGEYCAIKVRASQGGLQIEPDWCRSATTEEFATKLTEALRNQTGQYRWASLMGPSTPQNLADLSAAWGATCKTPNSSSFVKHYMRSATASAVQSAFSSMDQTAILESADNFYVVNPSRMTGAIRAKGCKFGLLMPVLYFRISRNNRH